MSNIHHIHKPTIIDDEESRVEEACDWLAKIERGQKAFRRMLSPLVEDANRKSNTLQQDIQLVNDLTIVLKSKNLDA